MLATPRLNATSQTAVQPHGQSRGCLECGAPLSAELALFCSHPCRARFNNRRIQRGGELYDLFMANRYDRAASALIKLRTGLSVFVLMCRMAQEFRRLDVLDRAGRKSWRDPATVVDRHPTLFAKIVYTPKIKASD